MSNKKYSKLAAWVLSFALMISPGVVLASAEVGPKSSIQEQNIEKIRKLFEAISQGRQAEAAREIAGQNFARHDLTGAIPGVQTPQGATRFIDDIRASFPDFVLTIEDILAAEDKVMVRFVATGTHTGAAFLGVTATGNEVSFYNMNMYRFSDGKMVETWQLADFASLMKQLQQ